MKNKNELGKYLAKLRVENNEAVKDMANRIGYSATHINNISTGLFNCNYEFCEAVCKAYRLDAIQKINFLEIVDKCNLSKKVSIPIVNDANERIILKFLDIAKCDDKQFFIDINQVCNDYLARKK